MGTSASLFRHFAPAVTLVPALAVALGACSSTSNGSPSGVGIGPEGGTNAEEACSPPPGKWEEGRDPPAYCVKEVVGKLLAAGGATPIAGLITTVCGRACFGGTTDPTGAFRVRVNARLPDGQFTLFAHGRPRYASLFVPLPAAPPERIEISPIELAELSADGPTLPPDDGPEATVRVGPIALGIPAGTSWQLAFEDAADDVDGRKLRFVKVPVDRAPRFAEGATLVYAMAPFDAAPSKPVSLSLAETGGLAPGSAVDVVVMQGFDITEENKSGQPTVAARGRVTADGMRIETEPGQGLSVLTWIAIRPSR